MSRRGFMLLEIMLAVAAAVLAAVAGFALLSRIQSRVERESERLIASDMACSVLALIESRAATAENLHGSVQTAVISLDDVESGAFVRDPVFRIEIESTPTQWAGLVQMDVSVLRVEDDSVAYTASQLVRQSGGAR
ncbi:MAG: hypothetical protein COB69_00050 [Phycisphaera sp.]|nr:MAG: hypothetical protein COB69_00050 [Phycisphaera sp.]